MCLYPRLIDNPKYRKNKKNGGNVPIPSDNRVKLVPIGCGRCIECKKAKQREWQVRLLEEIKHDDRGKFITFTFNRESLNKLRNEVGTIKIKDGIRKTIKLKNGKTRNYYNYVYADNPNIIDGYDLDNKAVKRGVRLFLERWRQESGKSVKHWFVTELGQKGTERIHIHGFLFTRKNTEYIEKKWLYGHVYIGDYVNEKSINYMVKYFSKIDEAHRTYEPIILTSAGIGKGYFKRNDSKRHIYKKEKTREYYVTNTGHKLALPIYYRNYLFTEEQREQLWLQKLDKEERWVMGMKIDISKGDDIYYKRLDTVRKRNREFLYGDNTINWKMRNYENARRNLKKFGDIKTNSKSPTG